MTASVCTAYTDHAISAARLNEIRDHPAVMWGSSKRQVLIKKSTIPPGRQLQGQHPMNPTKSQTRA